MPLSTPQRGRALDVTFMTLHISSPFDSETIKTLRAGDQVLISGIVYVGRDSAHKRIVEALDRGDDLPFDVQGQTIYHRPAEH